MVYNSIGCIEYPSGIGIVKQQLKKTDLKTNKLNEVPWISDVGFVSGVLGEIVVHGDAEGLSSCVVGHRELGGHGVTLHEFVGAIITRLIVCEVQHKVIFSKHKLAAKNYVLGA